MATYFDRMMKFNKPELIEMMCEQKEKIHHQTADLQNHLVYINERDGDLVECREKIALLRAHMRDADKHIDELKGTESDLRRHISIVERQRNKAELSIATERTKTRKFKVLFAEEILEGEE